VLLDGHSIRSEVPRFFSGRRPDLNLGSADGRSAALSLAATAWAAITQVGTATFSAVRNGRFRGDITRRYGQPAEGIHALQLEMAQACYMDEEKPGSFEPARAEPIGKVLYKLLEKLIGWRPDPI